MCALDPTLCARIEAIVGARITAAVRNHRGYTPAERWVVELAAGAPVFVKIGVTERTAGALRREHRAYTRIRGEFMAAVRGWDDPGDGPPLLVLEDLSREGWPPPWTRAGVRDVCDALARLHRSSADLPAFAETHAELRPGWALVAADPTEFLGLRIAPEAWLRGALPALLEQEARAVTAGDSPAHLDVRSDNICLAARGVVLLDWEGACLADPRVDLGFWLPSLASEGGPSPWEVLPAAPAVAAYVSGYFAARAGRPEIPEAPRVRQVQREQLGPALAWAVHELGLPPLARG